LLSGPPSRADPLRTGPVGLPDSSRGGKGGKGGGDLKIKQKKKRGDDFTVGLL